MVLIARTAPEPRERPTTGPTPLTVARAVTVVAAGPIALDAWMVLSPVAVARRWPDRLARPARRRTAWALALGGLLAPAVYGLAVRPWLQHWGSTDEERRRRWPGDGATRPLFTSTRAVTVEAPATEVWRWLVQIGQDKGGFYSYDWLENLAGCDLRSADEIHEEWQDLSVGDDLTMFPGYATSIVSVDPPRSLVIEGWGAYVVEPVDTRTCRLVARSHQDRSLGALGYVAAIELPHAIMERRMLLGLKRRAEAAARAS